MSRLRWPESTNSVSEKPGTIHLHLSFNTRNKARHKVDADIDIYTDALRHLFGEVLRNHFSGIPTDPFRVYQILTETGVPLAYRLLAAKQEVA